MPVYATSNDHWLHAITEQCANNGNDILLIGSMGNISFSWGVPRALTAFQKLRYRRLRSLYTYLRSAAKSRFTLRMSIAHSASDLANMSAINPAYLRSLLATSADRIYSLELPSEIANEPGQAERFDFISPEFGASAYWAEIGRRYGVSVMDPTADSRLLKFAVKIPNRVFMGPQAQSRWLARQIAPAQAIVADPNVRGYQGSDLIAKLRQNPAQVNDLLDNMDKTPMAVQMIDIPELWSIWKECQTRQDLTTHTRCFRILMNGLAVGMFLEQYG